MALEDLPLDFGVSAPDVPAPATDTSYLYTPTSAQPGGQDFVAPTGYTPTFGFDAAQSYGGYSGIPTSTPLEVSYGGYSGIPTTTPATGGSYDISSLLNRIGQGPAVPADQYASVGRTDVSPLSYTVSGGAGGYQPSLYSAPIGPQFQTGTPLQAGAGPGGVVTPAPEAPPTDTSGGGVGSFLKSLNLSGGDLAKLLVGGAGGLISYLGAQKAQQQAADAAATYQQAGQTAAQQYQQLAQPTLTAGGTNLAMAQQGALSPAELQGFQAAQAQIAQGAAGGGGAAGAAQGAAALQRAYQAAVADQIKNATALLSIGDPIAQAAIQAELQGTQGGLDLELKYGSAASTALGQLMANLAGGIGKTA